MKSAPTEGPGPRDPWPVLRAELEARGFRPSRRYGQNFLLDDPTCAQIVAAAELGPGEPVLEVGVGLGFLTRHLLSAGARVLGVEIDGRLAAWARERLPGPPQLALLEADVLAGKHTLSPEVVQRLPEGGPWSLVSNLPYSVASPVLVLVSRLPNPPRRQTVLVQGEVAERLCAGPGSGEWGTLPARLAPLYRGRILRRVPPGSFRPRPQVDSAVVQLTLRPDRPQRGPLPGYDELISALFPERRKRVWTPLCRYLGSRDAAAAALARAGVEREARVEELTVDDLWRLAAACGGTADTPSG
jgi:16S rRNA (adenine1518-N6/adenine1519-N6)-dimethyltransferase